MKKFAVNFYQMNNLDLIAWFTYTPKPTLFSLVMNNRKSFTQERINQIDSWTWRKIINRLPNMAYWCNTNKLELSDRSNLYLGNNGDNLLCSKLMQKTMKFFYNWNNKKHQTFSIKFKSTKLVRAFEIKNKIQLKFDFDLPAFDFTEIAEVFKNSDLSVTAVCYDTKAIYLTQDENQSIQDLMPLVDDLIKNNLYNLVSII